MSNDVKFPSRISSIEARYLRAQALMQGIWTKKLYCNTTLFPIWIENSDYFWYERDLAIDGFTKQYRLVNAATASNDCAFDHESLAAALGEAAGEKIDSNDLPLNKVKILLNPVTEPATAVCEVHFTAFDKRWCFLTETNECLESESQLDKESVTSFVNHVGLGEEIISPDGRRLVYVQDHNLWVLDITSGKRCALTKDGEELFSYASTGKAWYGSSVDSGLQARWSPDSRYLFTVQQDMRQVQTTPITHYVPKDGSLRPTIEQLRFANPGGTHIHEYRLVTIDLETSNAQEIDYQRVPVSRNGWGFFNAGLGWWSSDSQFAYFVDIERDYKTARVVEVNPSTGSIRVLFEETSETQINISVNCEDYPPFFVIEGTNELVWWSERSGWAHLYLYDLSTGKLKNPITEGKWQVRDVVQFNAQRREVFIQTAGRIPGRNPYYRDLARVNIDTGEITTLASSDHEYISITQKNQTTLFANYCGLDVSAANGVSPSGNYAVVTRSRADEIPISTLVNREGQEILELEVGNISALNEVLGSTWQWPEPVQLLSADGETDIYGLVFRPSNLSPEKKYPVISHVFNTPELSWVSKGSFSNGLCFGWPYLDAWALAELGFIVVQIDGRGTPYRHKAFQDESYGWAPSASNLDDHIGGIRQLAKRYPYMDIERVGITSHPSGGPGGVQGLLEHPNFYTVGVSSVQHDSRFSSASMWANKFEGPNGPNPEYHFPEDLVENLKGKLLMTQGMLDRPQTVFRVIEALHKANKDFDLILLPNLGHEMSSYMIRRTWDYLVRHLLAVEPPSEFELTAIWDGNK